MTFKQMAILSLNLMSFVAAADRSAAAEDVAPSEYQMKAAFVYNFARFVEWPPTAFPAADSPFVIGILGEDAFKGELHAAVKDKKVGAHALTVRQLKNVSEVGECHILFINPSEARHWNEITAALGKANVLLVSERWNGFLDSGGMIELFMDNNRVRFEISHETARRAGLKISSKLLLLSKKRPVS